MLHIDEKYAREMVAHALEEDPNECCGILGGRDGQVLAVYRMTNVEASPYRYRMDPVEQLRVYREMDEKGWETIAIYHSHTHSQAYPSPTDVRLATWPEERYVLISLSLPDKVGMRIWIRLLRRAYALLRRLFKFIRQAPLSLLDRETPSIRAFHIEDGNVIEEEVRIGGREP